MTTRPLPQLFTATALGVLLLTASLFKIWSQTRYPLPPNHSWIDGPVIVDSTVCIEAVFGLILVAGFWPRRAWYAALAVFTLFAIITAIETIQGKSSCGCFGAVQVRPIYTMGLDIAAVVVLLGTGRKEMMNDECGMMNEDGMRRLPGIVAGMMGVAWVGIVLSFWLTRPVIAAVTGEVIHGQEFGQAGELVVLEPEKWAGQRFALADHIDVGSQLTSGQWIVLLVHHDCDHCAAAVAKYQAEYGGGRESGVGSQEATHKENSDAHLAVIEMPPYSDADNPALWDKLPASVLSGRLDQTRDWFATTPVELDIKDGIIISTREGDGTTNPNPSSPTR